MKLTAEILIEHGACRSEVKIFKNLFPKGAKTGSAEDCRKATDKYLPIYWVIRRFCSSSDIVTYYKEVDDDLYDWYRDRENKIFNHTYASPANKLRAINRLERQWKEKHAVISAKYGKKMRRRNAK